jgi:hypothetical protein
MKSPLGSLGFFSTLLRVALFMILLAGVSTAEDKQIVDLNGSFEIIDAGKPAQWQVFGPVDGMPSLTEETPHGGSYALRVPIGRFSAGKISGVQQAPPSNLFKPGDIITIAVNVRLQKSLDEGTDVSVGFQITAPNSKSIASTHCKPENLPGKWQTLTSALTIPAGFVQDDQLKVIASVSCSKAPTQENVVDFDDIVLGVTHEPVSTPAAK